MKFSITKDINWSTFINGALASALFGVWMHSWDAAVFMLCSQAFVVGLIKYAKGEK